MEEEHREERYREEQHMEEQHSKEQHREGQKREEQHREERHREEQNREEHYRDSTVRNSIWRNIIGRNSIRMNSTGRNSIGRNSIGIRVDTGRHKLCISVDTRRHKWDEAVNRPRVVQRSDKKQPTVNSGSSLQSSLKVLKKTNIRKSIYRISNADDTSPIDDVMRHITSLNVRIISCFELKPSPRQKRVINHSASAFLPTTNTYF